MGRDESTDRVARSFLAFLSLFSVKCLTKDAPRAEQFFCVEPTPPPLQKKLVSLGGKKKEKRTSRERERERKHTFTSTGSHLTIEFTHNSQKHARARETTTKQTRTHRKTHTYTINNILINEPKWGDINIRGAVHETFDVDGEVS